METIRIEIINPKAKRLLKDLADLNLIAFKPKSSLTELLDNLRKNTGQSPTLDEITSEVEQVRKVKYAEKALGNH